MGVREYKLRVPREIPEATSEQVAAWMEEAGEGGRLASDPGGGPVRISLSLDSEKVIAFANKRRCKVQVALRRLIASHVQLEPVAIPKDERPERTEAEVLLPDRVLPRKLSYEAEDFLDVIRGLDKGLALLYRRAYGLKELKPAETPAEDRKLAEAMAEVSNRRSPAWLISNADLVRLGISSFRWSMAQTEDLDARVREGKGSRNVHKPAVAAPVMNAPSAPAAQAEPEAPDAAAMASAMVEENLSAPVQQEGEF